MNEELKKALADLLQGTADSTQITVFRALSDIWKKTGEFEVSVSETTARKLTVEERLTVLFTSLEEIVLFN